MKMGMETVSQSLDFSSKRAADFAPAAPRELPSFFVP
jgi:hypothetical protein